MFCYEECWLFDTHLYRTQAARHGKKVPITPGSQIARLNVKTLEMTLDLVNHLE